MFGDDLLQEQHQQALPTFHSESTLEPIIKEHTGVADRRFRRLHGFFPQSWKKEPFQKKIKRLSSQRASQGAGRTILKVHHGRPKGHFTQNSAIIA